LCSTGEAVSITGWSLQALWLADSGKVAFSSAHGDGYVVVYNGNNSVADNHFYADQAAGTWALRTIVFAPVLATHIEVRIRYYNNNPDVKGTLFLDNFEVQ
jgi:hypothetical protein